MAADPSETIGFYLPDEHEAGVYANAFTVWHTVSELTIDFAATQQAVDDDLVPARIVGRVRIPPMHVFELIQAIHRDLSDYEAEWGEIPIVRSRREGRSPESSPEQTPLRRMPLREIVPAIGSVAVVGVPVPTVVRVCSVPVNAPVEVTTTLALSSSTLFGLGVIVNGSAAPFAVDRFHVPARVATVIVVSLSLPHAIRASGSASKSSLRIESPPPRVVRVATSGCVWRQDRCRSGGGRAR